MSSYCVRCKKETNTNDIQYENRPMQTKTGKTMHRAMMTGTCAICGTKKTKFVKADASKGGDLPLSIMSDSGEDEDSNTQLFTDGDEENIGQGATYRVSKRDMSKRTYTALKEMIKTGKPGYLTFGDTKFYVSPASISNFKKASQKGVLKKAAQVMSGEKSHREVVRKIKTKGGSIDALGTLSDILGVVGMLL